MFKAKDRESGEIVALKVVRLDEDDEGVPSAALREICLLKEMKHKNIVCLMDVLHRNLRLTMVFEYIDQVSVWSIGYVHVGIGYMLGNPSIDCCVLMSNTCIWINCVCLFVGSKEIL